jgi:hypothetical protein
VAQKARHADQKAERRACEVRGEGVWRNLAIPVYPDSAHCAFIFARKLPKLPHFRSRVGANRYSSREGFETNGALRQRSRCTA